MRRQRLPILILVVAFSGLAAPPAQAPAERPVLLLLGGGRDLPRASALAQSEGFHPVQAGRPGQGFSRASRHPRRIARRYAGVGRAVFAYGESAGVPMAEALAARCLVEAAATISAPPGLTRRCSPVLAVHPPGEAGTRVGVRWLARRATRFHPQAVGVAATLR